MTYEKNPLTNSFKLMYVVLLLRLVSLSLSESDSKVLLLEKLVFETRYNRDKIEQKQLFRLILSIFNTSYLVNS